MSGLFFSSLNTALLALALFTATGRAADNGVKMMTEYFDLLISGNIESAGLYWTVEAQERSSRWGIEYRDVPLKIDCASPVIHELEMMRRNMQRPVRQVTEIKKGEFFLLEIDISEGRKQLRHSYYATNDGSYFWLDFPQSYYGRDWATIESKYLRIHAHPDMEKYLGTVTLEETDRFIERTAKFLKLSKSDLKKLAEKKIEYFYCDEDNTVKTITGNLVKGVYDLASDDIISSYFPHHHELSHFLINYKLRQLPLYTLPIMREGLAVYLGGRWGKAPTALKDLGGFLLREEIVPLDSLLTMSGFDEQAGSDIAYPVAGLFSSYLIDEIGIKEYLNLYLAMSGNADSLDALTVEDVRDAIIARVGKPSWSDLLGEVNAYIEMSTTADAVILPGKSGRGRPMVQKSNLQISGDKDWLVFEYIGANSDSMAGNVLFGYDEKLREASSYMFEQQYEGKVPFEGYRYGLRFDQNESGLYDYATSRLVAKYIWGITPSEAYYDRSANRITVSIRRSLVGKAVPSEGNFKLLLD